MRKSPGNNRWSIPLLFALAVFFAGAEAGLSAPSPQAGGGRYAGMVLIPAGPFTMGRDDGPPEEAPAHRVTLPAYYMDRNLVTWADYLGFIQKKGPAGPNGEMYLDVHDPDAKIRQQGTTWRVEKGFENHPATEMAWSGAAAYCRWRRKRLPTEAQWEKAARGGDGRLFPWGNRKPSEADLYLGAYRGDTTAVGRYPKSASPFGVNDMAGQVWEWTASLAMKYPYQPRDGRENAGAVGARVVRGGNSASAPEGMTATSREVVLPGRQASGHGYIGFRCAAPALHST